MRRQILLIVVAIMVVILHPRTGQATALFSLEEKSRLEGAVVLYIDSEQALFGTKQVQVDPQNKEITPIIKSSRTLVPLRFISESFGADVKWDGEKQRVDLITQDNTITLYLNVKSMIVNGAKTSLNVAPESINGRTFLPLRTIANALDKYVFYEDGLIVISKKLVTQQDTKLLKKLREATKPHVEILQANINRSGKMFFDGRWIYLQAVENDDYYRLNAGGNNALYAQNNSGYYRVKSDGSSKQKLIDKTRLKYVNVANGWMYYVSQDDHNGLYKVKLDGSEQKQVISDGISFVHVACDWIYFTRSTDDVQGLYRKHVNESEVKLITNDHATYTTIDGDTIYYTAKNDGNKLYEVKIDGTNRKLLVDDAVRDINVASDWIYFIDSSKSISKVKKDGTQLIVIKKADPNGHMDLQVDKNSLYFTMYSEVNDQGINWSFKNIYRMDEQGLEIERLTDVEGSQTDILDYFLYEDWIYYVSKQGTFRMGKDGKKHGRFSTYTDKQLNSKVTVQHLNQILDNEYVVKQNLQDIQDLLYGDENHFAILKNGKELISVSEDSTRNLHLLRVRAKLENEYSLVPKIITELTGKVVSSEVVDFMKQVKVDKKQRHIMADEMQITISQNEKLRDYIFITLMKK